MNKTRKIRGSASHGEDGSFVFTPYQSVPEGAKSLKLVKSGIYSSLWVSKKSVSVRFVFDRKCIPPYQVWIQELTDMYRTLNENLLNENH